VGSRVQVGGAHRKSLDTASRDPPPFVAITAQAHPNSPISRMPVDSEKEPKLRDQSADTEDTWCAILVAGGEGVEGWWAMAESVR
jgi:hypothetical protein